VLDRGTGHVYIRPATPRLDGKVERSHRIDADEFYRLLDGVVIDDTGLFNERLREWENLYNFNRPHGGLGLGGQTPYERLRQKTGSPVCPAIVSCTDTSWGGAGERHAGRPQRSIPGRSYPGEAQASLSTLSRARRRHVGQMPSAAGTIPRPALSRP
jgi:hypothetical protein